MVTSMWNLLSCDRYMTTPNVGLKLEERFVKHIDCREAIVYVMGMSAIY